MKTRKLLIMKNKTALLLLILLIIKVESAEIELPQVNENSFMMKMQSEALKDPFKGVFTSNGKENGLYPITSTGVTTEPIRKAGENFISSLSNCNPPEKK